MTKEKYDLVVLGGGIAGYSAAIRASQLGKSVALVEKDKVGGTCLHRGCIPTKSFLKSAEVYQYIQHADQYGLSVEGASVNFQSVLERKSRIVETMYNGVQHLVKQNKIDLFQGTGRLLGASIFTPQSGTVSVEYDDGESELLPNDYVLIATGSKPIELPMLPFDHRVILSSDDMMQLSTLPKRMAIVGGGVIGLEFASLLNSFGVEVTIIEAGERILINEPASVSRQLKQHLSKEGIHILENTAVTEEAVTITEHDVTFELDDTLTVDKVLVAVGRQALTDDLGLNNTKVALSNKKTIQTDAFMQTADQHIYAAGDVIGQLQLAHVGAKEGVIAVEHMFNENPLAIDYNLMPRCVYTRPEVASLGMTVDVAKKQGYTTHVVKAPFKANGKALIASQQDPDGFAELVFDKETQTFLGAALIGPNVTELINELSLLSFMDGSALELGSATHAHPSISELLMELGLKAENQSIHI
ncbi:dihydrolipoyl dehydrogenase [Staphylococcus agnetis]|uniref:Dihydrolipoyl dehydrogenase n=1 Tax=Staphylococcus agnetis TaxID=985762 RepID=A0ABX3Z3Z1_9STAP|nr:dihydrolipoyl dehydrogenase [Staphylococcus agnetis]ALN76485.1 dihydrolipoyl dehydrogenase [Staphylococcus agnetis]MDG4942532.1 dihydrolipoyl dehydrogenase [Staphylococcus agnetis]OSP13961.1 dihydrolipoyl dehydrogenase [Staphylococcus agnetis]OSP22502.1 dihydrolipoyl dehydrogenase [Staphylococcus agnetis]OTW31209.1 dihydrolipoyl dehydrogenase [Staphylococcus agnetis]